MNEIFGEQGQLNSSLDNYEYRQEQLQMADFILERLVENENGLIEAGTGTGKTLAYLIPAIIYAKENDKKVTVTTETKALQKQLLDKDLPVASDILLKSHSMSFSFSLMTNGSTRCRRWETLRSIRQISTVWPHGGRCSRMRILWAVPLVRSACPVARC